MRRRTRRLRWTGTTLAALATCTCALAFTAPTTLAAPQVPAISKESVSGVSETSATLKATIDPGERPTKYRFEYVDQASFEAEGFAAASRVPIPDGSIPAGNEGVAVQVTLEGLSPGTAYRFRAFAKNSQGEPTGPERLFATLAPPPSFAPCPNDAFRSGELSPPSHPSASLPDCRAYEQASPVDKNGGDALGTVPTVSAADDGDAFSFATQFGIPGGEGAQNIPTFLAIRGEGGWQSQGLLPPAATGTDAGVLGWQPDFSQVFSSASLLGEARETGFFSRSGSGGPPTQLAPYTSFQNGTGEYSFVGAAADGSAVFFEAAADLGSAPPGLEGKSNVYAWDREDQTLRLTAVMNDGLPPAKGAFAGPYDWGFGTTNTSLNNGGAERGYYTQDEHAVSADGSLYFTVAGSGQIYLRRNPTEPQSEMNGEECTEPDKACTLHVSATKRSAPDPAGTRPAAFMAASADGSTALFTSSEELTDNANTGPPQPAATIARAPIGGSPVKADFIPTHAVGVAVDSEHVYWADPTAGTIGRAELDGSHPEPDFIVPDPVEFEFEVETGAGEFEAETVIAPSRPRYVAVDAGHIYWTNTGRLDQNGDPAKEGGTIGRADIEGTPASVEADFIRGAFDPQGIAVNASHIYWANSSRQAQTISRAGIEGDEVEPSFFTAKASGELPYGVALSAGHVYFSQNDPTHNFGYIVRIPLEGGEEELVFIGTSGIHGIAVDATNIYWAEAAENEEAIGRMPIADFGSSCAATPTCEKDFIKAEGALEGLAADSEHLYFSSNGEAPPNPGNDLYRYDAGSGALSDLTPDSADENGAEVQGVLGASKDGSFVYFVANGDLDGPAGPATSGHCHGEKLKDAQGSCNLYLWHEGASSFIARLDAGGQPLPGWLDWAPTPFELAFSGGWLPKTAFAAADGRTLLFRSTEKLTAYENEGVAELYRYRLGEPLVCVSCNPSASAPQSAPTLGTVTLPVFQPFPPAAVAARNLSADGERAFFETTEALVAADTDGQAGCPLTGSESQSFSSCRDVYEWEAPGAGNCEEGGPGFSAPNGGCLYLLSPGNDGVPSIFGDASASGEDVFIFTRTPLVGQDEDELFDVYDARVGGGLPSQNEPPKVPCEGEACKHALAPPPSFEGPAGFSGPANPTAKRPGACPKGKRRVKSRCVVKKSKGHAHRKHRAAHRRGGSR